MYDELIAELRQHHCDAKEDDTQEVCEECAYDVIIADKSVPSGIASVCVCGLMHRAADAIEELQKRVPKTPHGRLIDADALMLIIQEYLEEYSDLDEDGMHNLKWCAMKETEMAINDAPTIVEADNNTQNMRDESEGEDA